MSETAQPRKKSLPAEVQQQIILRKSSPAALIARELFVDVAQVEEVLARLKPKARRR